MNGFVVTCKRLRHDLLEGVTNGEIHDCTRLGRCQNPCLKLILIIPQTSNALNHNFNSNCCGVSVGEYNRVVW